MSDHSTTKLVPETHLLLDQSLLRLPHELVRRNFKNAQRYLDREREHILPALKETANATLTSNSNPEQALAALDAMIARMQTLKRKLENLREEEEALHNQSAKRICHLQDLHEIPSLMDVKYDQWSRTRLDRLIVDYLLRAGHSETAATMAQSKDISHLIDLETFTSCHKIAASLQRGETKDALQWVTENRNALKKLPPHLTSSSTASGTLSASAPHSSNLEFELRLQQYITMIRTNTTQSRLDAIAHASKHLMPHAASRSKAMYTISGLLAQPPPPLSNAPLGSTSNNVVLNPHQQALDDTYRESFSPTRWQTLADLFIATHHALFGIPAHPLLHTALSAGLSALKTPACHSVHNPASASTTGHARIATNTSLCPICSTELNELARSVPYAHHTKSHVENDAVVLPNQRIYGRARLEELQRKILRAAGNNNNGSGSGSVHVIRDDMIGIEGEVTDPTTLESFPWADVKKVYIT